MEDQPEFDALGYLQAIYRGKVIAESQRMRAAIAALPFERPKLAVIANVTSFAAQMEATMERLGKPPVIDAKPRSLASEMLESATGSSV